MIMENMRDYISLYLKHKGMGMDEFLASCNISRSMFYRFLKEPFRFSDDQLELISEALGIADKEKSKLFAFKSDYRSTVSISREIETEILGILFSNPYEFRTNKCDFEYYDSDENKTYVLDTDGISDVLSDNITKMKHDDKNGLKCYLTIYNCSSAQKVSSIYSLLSSLEKRLGEQINFFRIIHYVNYQQDDLLSKLKAMKINLPLYSIFSDYHLVNTDLTDHPWASLVDFFVLKYGYQQASDKSGWRYMVSNMEHGRRAYAFSTDNYMTYKFFTCGMDEQSAYLDHSSDTGPLEINMHYQSLSAATRRIIISMEPCWDAITPLIWHDMFERVKNGPNFKIIRNMLDPTGSYKMYSDDQLVEFCVNSLKSRFEISEKNETKTIFTIDGLKTFTTQRMITEALVFGEPFTGDEIRSQLEYVKSRLGDMTQSGQQSFYIYNTKWKQPMYLYAILKNMLIGLISPKNANRLGAITLLKDKAIADALYEYILYEMIGKRNSDDSLLLSDAEASGLIDALISRI